MFKAELSDSNILKTSFDAISSIVTGSQPNTKEFEKEFQKFSVILSAEIPDCKAVRIMRTFFISLSLV